MTSTPCQDYSGLAQLGQRDGAAAQRLVGERGAPVVVAGRDAELVVQVGEVLLDGGLGDDELVGDRSRGRRLGEHVARQQRAAEGDEHVALARRQRRRRLLDLGGRAGGGQRIAEHEPGLADPDLVAVSQSARGPDTLAVDPRPVGGSEVGHAPAGREPLEHRVQVARGRVVGDGDVVLGGLADGRAVRLELEAPAAHAGDHLDLR